MDLGLGLCDFSFTMNFLLAHIEINFPYRTGTINKFFFCNSDLGYDNIMSV